MDNGWFAVDIRHVKTFAEALAIGMLIGVERYKDRDAGEQKSAGLRTFTVFALLGAVCGLLAQPAFTLATLGAMTALLLLGYYRHAVKTLGLTTESTALLTFWLGYLMHTHDLLAIGVGIVTTILLASKRALHTFVTEQISMVEFYDTLKFLAVVFVVFPLLPNRGLGPYGFFNPTQIWMLIILVSTISYLGYVLIRVLGGSRGLTVSAMIGGIVSTTAVTMSLAERAREAPALSRTCGVAGVMANAVQFPRLLLLVWVVDADLGRLLTAPLLGMGAVGMLGAWAVTHKRRGMDTEPPAGLLLRNPYSLIPALKFGLFFVAILLMTKAAAVNLGERGIYLASAVAGLGDASAISLTTANLVHGGSLSATAGAVAVLIAVTMNALLKWVLARVTGTRELARWLGGGFAAMLATGIILLVVVHVF